MNEAQVEILEAASAHATQLVNTPVTNMYATAGVIVGSTVRVVAAAAREYASEGWTLERFAEALLEVAEAPLDEEAEAAKLEDMEREMDRLVAMPDQVALREQEEL